MKSYLLFGISSAADAATELSNLLPSQRDPWVLRDTMGDAVAYFDVHPTNVDFEGPGDDNGPGPLVMANISGRHYNEDAPVIALLREVQRRIGGVLRDDKDQRI